MGVGKSIKEVFSCDTQKLSSTARAAPKEHRRPPRPSPIGPHRPAILALAHRTRPARRQGPRRGLKVEPTKAGAEHEMTCQHSETLFL